MFLQPLLNSFAVEVDPIDVNGRLDGVEEAPMVDVC